MHAPIKAPFVVSTLSKYLIAAAGIIPALLGLSVLVGWYAHIPALVQVRPYFVPMQYNTALCILFSGAGLCAFRWRHLRLAQVFGGAVALLAAITLCEYVSGRDLAVDQLFFRSYITTLTFHPGRMSPLTALCLLQLGVALVLMGLRVETKWRAVAVGSLGSIVIAICAAAVMGYAADLPGTYGWGRFTRIALHTAGGLALLGAGIFVFAWDEGRRQGELTPRWLPVPMGLGVLAISLMFSQALAEKQSQGTSQTVKASAESVGSIVNFATEARIRALERMAGHWEFSDHPSQPAWENEAKSYVKSFPDFEAVEWVATPYVVRWIAPPAGEDVADGRNLELEQKRRTAVKDARESREPVVTGMVKLSGGGLGFIICVPVYTGEKFDGCIAGLFQAQALFDRYLPATVAPGYTIAISGDGRTYYIRNPSPAPANKDWIFTSSIEQPGTTWEVAVWPGPALVKQMESSLPKTLLFVGMFRAIIFGLIIYLAQKSSGQARKATVLNRELETALAEVRQLSGMLPICAGCKRIRDDSGYWNEIERYVARHSDASFSHGICPECAKTFYEREGLPVPEDILQAVEKHDYD